MNTNITIGISYPKKTSEFIIFIDEDNHDFTSDSKSSIFMEVTDSIAVYVHEKDWYVEISKDGEMYKCWGLTFSEVDTMISDLNKKKLQVDDKYTLNFEIY